MFEVDSPSQASKIVEIVDQHGITTKNIPSAMNWHCSSSWKHLDFVDVNDASNSAFAKLSRYIAIPILLEKSIDYYTQLAQSISSYLQ